MALRGVRSMPGLEHSGTCDNGKERQRDVFLNAFMVTGLEIETREGKKEEFTFEWIGKGGEYSGHLST